jgi:hypothetical protein
MRAICAVEVGHGDGTKHRDFFETRFLLTDVCDGSSEVEAVLLQSF